jgi:hypothetical protein
MEWLDEPLSDWWLVGFAVAIFAFAYYLSKVDPDE